MSKILSIDEVAAILGCAPRTLKNKLWSVQKTTLPPAHKTGRTVYFVRDKVEDWLVKQPVINAPAPRRGRPRKNVKGVAVEKAIDEAIGEIPEIQKH